MGLCADLRVLMAQVVIVGGGISGLSAAYYLSQQGHQCTLIEKQARLGGVIRTQRVNGCLVEAGPDSFLAQKPWAMDLIRELRLEDQVIGSQDRLRRTYILRSGRLIALPEGIQFLAPTKLTPILTTPLFTVRSKVRLVLEWFRRPENIPDESVADFVCRHYGCEVNEYLAQPMLAGVYGGSPEKLSVNSVLPRFVELARKHGSLTKGILSMSRTKPPGPGTSAPVFQTLKNGMQQLTDCVVERLQSKVRFVTATAGHLARLGAKYHLRTNAGPLEAEQIVLAIPAFRSAELLHELHPQLAELLLQIPYHSSITISLLYRRPGFGHPLNGFGFLVPRAERKNLAACTWVNTKFAHRAHRNTALLRGFLAGKKAGEHLSATDADLADLAHRELDEAMGCGARPKDYRVQRWHRAMAQYEVGHQKRLEAVDESLRDLPGLYLAGNGFTGIGVPDCIRRSRSIAEQVGQHVEKTRRQRTLQL